MSESEPQLGVDVGGTNTDVVLATGDDEYRFKTPTTEDPSVSTVHGIETVCEQAGVPLDGLGRIFHGTTIATNAVIESEWARTGLVTTKGFRDVLHIGRHRKPENFSIQVPIPWQERPVVERRHRKTVDERIYPTDEGSRVETPLDTREVRERAGELVDDGIETIAVCFLHSYLDPTHEQEAKAAIEDAFPDVFVCTSSDVVGQFREYERFTTTAINASLQPRVAGYLDRLSERLTKAGVSSDILIMQSNGGVADIDEIARRPVRILNSGPAAGVLAATEVADAATDQADGPDLITLDMGGTSADIAVVSGSVPERDPRDSTIAGGYPVLSPMVDVEAIGSGGGSIAWFDRASGFNIGPKSAGAEPGPVCYGRGNDEPTVTDAQAVLGRLNPDTFLGGEFELDVDAARSAIREKLCGAVEDEKFATERRAALSTLEVAITKMQQEIRKQTVRRGHDPREFTLVGFGGAGPLHACAIAEQLDISTVLIPPSPGVASAKGALSTDFRHVEQTTIKRPLETIGEETLGDHFERLEGTCRERLSAMGAEKATYEATTDCVYEGQGYELRVPFDGLGERWRGRLRERFEQRHRDEYGHAFESDPVVVLNLRVTGIGAVETPAAPALDAADEGRTPTPTTVDRVVFGTATDQDERAVPRYAREELLAGHELDGPAVVDASDTTILVEPGWTGTVGDRGAISLRRAAE
jgi:N-methylhydantoinase A